MGYRQDDDLQQCADKQHRLLQIENEIARLIAELKKIDAALAQLHPLDRAPDAIVN
jgi:hypothetical protein